MLTNEKATSKIKEVSGLSSGNVRRKDVAYVLVKCLDDATCKNKTLGFVSGDKDIDAFLKSY